MAWGVRGLPEQRLRVHEIPYTRYSGYPARLSLAHYRAGAVVVHRNSLAR
jgi:hypothetical protein